MINFIVFMFIHWNSKKSGVGCDIGKGLVSGVSGVTIETTRVSGVTPDTSSRNPTFVECKTGQPDFFDYNLCLSSNFIFD